MSIRYASDLNTVKIALSPAPLLLSELEFFHETSDARDPRLVRRDQIFEHLQTESNTKILLTGHAGCGKSTELVKFQEEHRDKFAFVSFSLIEEAQLSHASIEAILVLIVEKLVREIYETLNLKLNEETLNAVHEWFSEAFEIKENDLKYTGQIGVGADTQNTLWGKLLGVGAYLKADIRTGSHTLHRSITKENRRLSELAYQCNLLIKDAGVAVRKELKRELVLIIEDLDKVELQAADEILIQNPAPIADLACKAIYTAPLWLLCTPRSNVLDSLFKKVNLPMIKVKEKNGEPCEQGRGALKEILRRRMDLDQLVEEEALDLAIEQTGGVLRHLFDVLITAASTAKQGVLREARSEERILLADVRYGLDQLKSELVRRIGVFGLPKEYQSEQLTVENMYARLREIVGQPCKLQSDFINLLLMQAHAIIEYNGAGWHCIHPLIAEYLKES
jgi:hypothetical protein